MNNIQELLTALSAARAEVERLTNLHQVMKQINKFTVLDDKQEHTILYVNHNGTFLITVKEQINESKQERKHLTQAEIL